MHVHPHQKPLTATGESEQVVDQACGLVARPNNIVGDVPDFVGRNAGGPEEVGAAADHRQHIVDVVGNVSSKLTDRLHLFGLTEHGLQSAPFGHVLEDEDRA